MSELHPACFKVLLTSVLAFCGVFAAGAAQPLRMKPFAYHEDFENNDPVQFLKGGGKYTINFQGITGEKAFSGKKSYKIDVSFHQPFSSCDFVIPLPEIPATGTLRFSGMIRVEQALPKSRGILAIDFSYWPYKPDGYSGDRSFPWNVQCPEWVKIVADIPDRANALAWKMFPREFWPAEPDCAAAYVQRIKIRLFARDKDDAKSERRVVVYLDDLRIEGETAESADYRKDAERRWAPVQDRTRQKLAAWSAAAAKAEDELKSLGGLSGESEKLRAELLKKLKQHNVRGTPFYEEALKSGWMTLSAYEKFEPFYDNLRDHFVANVKCLSQNPDRRVGQARASERGPTVSSRNGGPSCFALGPPYQPSDGSRISSREIARPEAAERIRSRKYLVYDVGTRIRPAEWVLPDTVLVPGRLADEMEVRACPGEYESASFVVKSFAGVKSLRVEPGDLTGPAGKIAAGAIDVKVIKCWYQENPDGGRALMPELLLNDEDLVRVDHARKISLIKFNLPQGPKHLSADDPEWPKDVDRKTQTPVWVANDSDVLLPVEIPAGENKQFWVTVKVPEDAKPGEYTGKIRLSVKGELVTVRGDCPNFRGNAAKMGPGTLWVPSACERLREPLGEVVLRLVVLPIQLLPPYYETSVFVHGGENTIEKRYRSELRDQVAHGITAPMHFFEDVTKPRDWLAQLERTLKIRQELGVPAGILIGNYFVVYGPLAGGKSHKGLIRIDITDEMKKDFRDLFQKYLAIMRSYGIKDVYFHLADERDAKELQAWLPVFEVLHQAGGKVITCLQIGNSFEMVGGITDVFFCENGISAREAAKWHSKGSKIWPVWNPRGGVEETDMNRRNHGLWMWRTGCDGVTEYLYSQERAWLEAASTAPAAAGDGVHSMVYRTTDGVIDTIQWEGFREGVDDVRYVTTLEQAIKKARASGSPAKGAVAAEAEKYLAGVDVRYGDLDAIRSRVIEYILALTGK